MSKLSIVSLNIEHDRHIPEVLAFLENRQPDIVLLQEVYKKDLYLFEDLIGKPAIYSWLALIDEGDQIKEIGNATLSRVPLINHKVIYYSRSAQDLEVVTLETIHKMARALIITEVSKDNKPYCVVNNHFTWSANGLPSPQQYIDCERMLEVLSPIPELVMCGDFNAPRGSAIFDMISKKYCDNIPKEVKSTLDRNKHLAGHLDLVVDGFFTSNGYLATDVKVIDGISDHCAISGNICHVDSI